MNIGEKIKELRKERNMSARELARRSGISQGYLSQLETGKNSNPTNEVLNKIAKGLNIPNGTLLLMAGYVQDPFDYMNMTEEDQEHFIKQQEKRDFKTWNIQQYQERFHVQIEDFLNDERKSFYIDGHKLTHEEIKMLITLYGGKEKDYPTDKQLEKEYEKIKNKKDVAFFVTGADHDINTDEGE